MSFITTHNISVIRQGQAILHDVSLDIKPHDFITIIGPNGAGKSMLLKCLLGFFAPDKGHITCKPDLKIGYMPQYFTLEPTIPINVKHFICLTKQAKNFDDIVSQTGIEPLLSRPLISLSGGERQRVLLARSLLDSPQLLVLDEPAQNLDISGQLQFYNLLEQIYKNQKLAIVMISHDLHMVMKSTKQVICLYHHICCSGKPQAVTKDPEFIALFGNDMAKMMAVYQHSHDHGHYHGHHHESGHEHHGADDHA
ncbi:MAG: ATP-binding cassette domain-containing protein [Alphaproteobacteria bacterium]|nr:ATP-binding cassette domain-containing protein [Alphaproteobacteria bacterium]